MQDDAVLDRRPSPIAGSWYPGNALKLRAMIEGFLSKAPPLLLKGTVQALIVPHAGYIYSGQTAACAFKALQGKSFSKVVVISPSHQAYEAPLLTSGHDAYTTPLGDLLIDHESVSDLNTALQTFGLELTAIRNDREHSLEIELPFLQVALREPFSLIPIMMVDQRRPIANALSQALGGWIKRLPPTENILLVASSDQSHFYTQQRAELMDQAVIEALKAQNTDLLYRLDAEGRGEACGLGPMATVILTCQALGKPELQICDHRTSAAATGDESSVVGYTSAILTKNS
jgi:AmmeMemoRadiSam system protein B